MAEVASAYVSLLPSGRGFGRKLDGEISGDVKSSGKRLGAMFGKLFAVAGGLAVGKFLGDSLGEAREAQRVSALTTAVIKSTGGAAKVSAKHVDNLASAISRKTGIDDEQIASAQNLLLTFKNVRNESGKGNKVFDQATTSIVDMAAAMAAASGGQIDFRSATTMVGKALNDPIKGLAAMGRVGVQFTEQQKEQIKTLVGSGKTMEAQKVILKELSAQFGGAAAAQATAGDKAKVAWGNFQEAVGTLLLPAVDRGLTGFTKLANFATDRLGPAVSDAVGKFGPKLRDIATITWGKLSGGIDALRKLTQLDFSKLDGKKLGEQLGSALVDGLAAAGSAIAKVTKVIGSLLAKVDWVGIGIMVGKQAPALLVGLAAGILNFDIGSLLSGMAAHWSEILIGILAIAFAPSKLVGPLARILGKIPFVGRFLAAAVTWVNQLGGKLLKFGGDLMRTFAQGFGRVGLPGAALVGRIMGMFRALPGRLREFMALLKTRLGVWALDAFGALGRGSRAAIGKTLGFVRRVPGMILKAVASLARLLFPRGSAMIEGLAKGAAGRIGRVLSTVRGIPKRILGALGNLGSTLYHSGQALIQGLINGITSKLAALASKMKEVANKIKGFLPGSPVKTGPLTSWNNGGAGKRLVGMLADGLHDTSPIDAAMSRMASRIATPSVGMSVDPRMVASASGSAAAFPSRVRLVVDGHEFTAYVDARADRRVGSVAAAAAETSRAGDW